MLRSVHVAANLPGFGIEDTAPHRQGIKASPVGSDRVAPHGYLWVSARLAGTRRTPSTKTGGS